MMIQHKKIFLILPLNAVFDKGVGILGSLNFGEMGRNEVVLMASSPITKWIGDGLREFMMG